MTRFGMGPEEFRFLAGLVAGIILQDRRIKHEVRDLRRQFRDLRYCFGEEEFPQVMRELRAML
jgi:aminomethyltransferase